VRRGEGCGEVRRDAQKKSPVETGIGRGEIERYVTVERSRLDTRLSPK